MATHKKIEIDATGEVLGRMASKIARILMGKTKANYTPNVDSGDKVVVLNPSGFRLTGKKMDQKLYRHHTAHPGGLREVPAKRLYEENPEEMIKHAVLNMLPRNRLRTIRMKRLTFKTSKTS